MKNYYDILGLSPEATLEEVKDAYRMMAMLYHPDRSRESPKLRKFAEERFKEINEAYEVLSDPNKRRVYDQENEFVIQKPKPVVSPQTIDFGEVGHGEVATKTLRVENQGGPAKELNFDFPPDAWFQLGEIVPVSEKGMFPLEVEVLVESEWLTPGRSYSGSIVVDLDGEKAEVEVLLKQVVTQPAPASTYTPAPVAATSGGNVLNFRYARVCMWYGILVGLAWLVLFGGVSCSLIADGSGSALVAFLIATPGLIASLGGGYVLNKTNNLKNPENAKSAIEQITALTTMVAGGAPIVFVTIFSGALVIALFLCLLGWAGGSSKS